MPFPKRQAPTITRMQEFGPSKRPFNFKFARSLRTDCDVTPGARNRPSIRDLTVWRQTALHFGINKERQLERTMNTICRSAMIAGLAFSAFAFATMAGSSVQAGPIVPPGRYCMTWDIGGSDCSFTSYEQCLATASGLDAECYGETLRDEDSQSQDRRGYNSRAQVPPTRRR
jgi:hypothetical protein